MDGRLEINPEEELFKVGFAFTCHALQVSALRGPLYCQHLSGHDALCSSHPILSHLKLTLCVCLCAQDLPRPECLMKPAEAMTEEELKIAKEFEKREAELLEEREKYKKVLISSL